MFIIVYRLVDSWSFFFSCPSCLLHLPSGHFTAPLNSITSPSYSLAFTLLPTSPHFYHWSFWFSFSSSFEGAFPASRHVQKRGHSTSCVSYSCHEVNKRLSSLGRHDKADSLVCLASNVVTWSSHDQTCIWRRDKERNIERTSSATFLFSHFLAPFDFDEWYQK